MKSNKIARLVRAILFEAVILIIERLKNWVRKEELERWV